MADVTVTPMKGTQTLKVTQEWDKLYPKSNKVEYHKVFFKNRYGITLVGDLFVPKNIKQGDKLPALAVAGAFGAVKEQTSGYYAQTMAERGYVALAFDPSFTGESGGEPRNIASPDINTEDFSAAVDYLGLQNFVDRNKIGIIGVCGWGGMALNATITDKRIKAVATTVMYDMSRNMTEGYRWDKVDATKRAQTLDSIGKQRWIDAETGETGRPNVGLPLAKDLTGKEPHFIQDYANFYRSPKGFHERSVNSNSAWSYSTAQSFINFPLMDKASEMTQPVLMIVGERAHSRYMGEDAFKALGSENKELVVVPNANHTDMYYNSGKIPFDKIDNFFKVNLK